MKRPLWQRWAVGLVALLAAFTIRHALQPWLHDRSPYLTFLPAILVTAWFGGFRSGLLATVAAGILASWSFVPAWRSWAEFSSHDAVALLLYFFNGFFISIVCGNLHRAVMQAARAREEGALRFEIMANHSPGLIWVSNTSGQRIFFNEAWLKFVGASLDPERDNGWMNRVHPDDRENVETAFRDAATIQGPFRCEYRLRREDGVFRWLLDNARPRFNATGAFEGYIGSCIDITETRAEREERKAAEQELERQRKLLKTIVDAVPAMISYIDAEERYVVHNRQYHAYFKFRPEEIAHRPVREVLGATDYAKVRSYLRRAFEGETVSYETPFVRPNGKFCTLHVSYTPDPGDDGRVRGVVVHIFDVTDRKETEAALARSEERYRTLVTASTSIVWMANAQGKTIEASGWEEYTGQPREQFVGSSWISAVHPDDLPEVTALWHAAEKHRIPFEAEYRLNTRQGAYRHVRTRGAPLFAPDGSVREWIGTINDIHARKTAQEALRRKEAELQVIIDAVPALLSYVDRDLRYGLVNQSYKRWFGLPGDELRGRPVEEVIGPAAFAQLENDFRQVLSGRAVHVEKHMPYLHGGARSVEIICMPHLAENGSVLGFVGFVHDITHRKKIEQQLADALGRYRFLAEAVPQIVWTATRDGRFDYFNRQWTELTGLSAEETVERGWDSVLHPDDAERFMRGWNEAVRSGSPFEIEQRFRRASDQTYRWQLCRALPRRDDNGKIVQWIGTCTDLDEQKQAYSELAAAREELRLHAELLEERVRERTAGLREANEELEAFSYSVSHDLRTPLQFVQGFSEAILDDRGNTLTDESRDYMRRIIHASSRMDTIIRDLLLYSRLSRSEMPITTISLDEVIEDVLQHHRAAIQQAGVEVTILPALPQVQANATGLFQAVSNLVANAIKFVSPHRSPTLVIRSETFPGKVRLRIEDNGIGIDPQYHERIFRLFERLHGASQYTGTGIGLSLVKKAIDRMGASVGVESELDRGSSFYIDFPVES